MPCYRPISAWFTRDRHPTGGRVISFGKHGTHYDRDQAINLPCGRCIGCRLERSRQWAVRILHESQLHPVSSFLTLTYDPQKIPKHNSLDKKHVQDFMKRLRSYQAERDRPKVRFFLCGEYGDATERPHYHLILFGENFAEDRTPYKKTDWGPTFKSESLNRLWSHGFCVIGNVSFESAAYVARYCIKKITGPAAQEHYGERIPEFATMSRRPGIAADWFKRYNTDVYPTDEVIMRGVPSKPPRYYDNLQKQLNAELFKHIQFTRLAKADVNPLLQFQTYDAEKSSPQRLWAKETAKKAKLSLSRKKI